MQGDVIIIDLYRSALGDNHNAIENNDYGHNLFEVGNYFWTFSQG